MGNAQFKTEDNILIEALQASKQPEVIKVDGEEFVTKLVYEPPKPALAGTLVINTLQGIVDYLKSDAKFDDVIPGEPRVVPTDDGDITLKDTGLAVHVLSESVVEIIGSVEGRYRQRETYVRANSMKIIGNGGGFKFGEYLGCETFNIFLRSLFAVTDDTEEIIKITGNITVDDQGNWKDDGLTQTVTARTGIAKVTDIEVRAIYNLQPFRTFREINQPTSDFLLRLRQNPQGGPPMAALFETDGGGWKLRAIEGIKQFLVQQLDGLDIPIIA